MEKSFIYKNIFIYTICIIFIANLVNANCTVLGVNIGNNFNGASICNNIDFKEKPIFNGGSDISDSLFEKGALFRGSTSIRSSVFKDNVNIKGALLANNAVFQSIELFGSTLNLYNSKVNKQIFINYRSFFSTPKVTIGGKSKIKGNIVFLGSKGEVELAKESIFKGKVINGRIKDD